MLPPVLIMYIQHTLQHLFPRRDILGKLISELELTNEEIGQYIKTLIGNMT